MRAAAIERWDGETIRSRGQLPTGRLPLHTFLLAGIAIERTSDFMDRHRPDYQVWTYLPGGRITVQSRMTFRG